MNIYILIVLCLYTLKGIAQISKGQLNNDKLQIGEGTWALLIGALAIIFQAIIM